MVSHSIFLKELFRSAGMQSTGMSLEERALVQRICRHKLPNCGTVAVLFDFGAEGRGETPAIIDAQLVFGTMLDRRGASISAPEAPA